MTKAKVFAILFTIVLLLGMSIRETSVPTPTTYKIYSSPISIAQFIHQK